MAIVRSAIAAARILSQAKTAAPKFSDELLKIARNEAHPGDLRLEALAALPNGLRSVEPALFNFIRENVELSKPVMTRSAAANVLSRAPMTNCSP
jgi:hypothetical protein